MILFPKITLQRIIDNISQDVLIGDLLKAVWKLGDTVFQIGFQWTENLMQSLSFSYQAFLLLGLLLLTNVASQEKIMLVKELNFL